MVVQAAEWTLAADVITNEQYAEVIRMIFVERLDLDPSAFIRTIILDFNGEDEYQLKHAVLENNLGAVYEKVRRSHNFDVDVSETRKLALALVQARSGAGVSLSKTKEAAEDADSDVEPAVQAEEEEEEALNKIDSCTCSNEGKVSLLCLISYISFVLILLLLPLLTVRLPFTCSVVDASCCTCTSWVRRMIGC